MNKYSGETKNEERRVVIGNKESNETISGRISVSHKKGSRFFKNMDGPNSFEFLSPRDTVCASVNVIAISRSMRNYLDHPPYNFSTRLDLCRDLGDSYRICIIPFNDVSLGPTVSPAFRDLIDILSVSPKGKKLCLFATFEKDIWIHLQFQHKIRYEYFFKMLKEILKMKQKSEKVNIPQELRGQYKPRQITKYRVPRRKEESIVKKLSGSVSVSTERGNPNDQFFEISSEDWLPPHFQNFLEHIFVQGRGMRRVMTLFDYMESLESKMFPDLISYLARNGGTNNNDEGRNDAAIRNYITLGREIENYEKNKTCHKLLGGVLCEDLVREKLKEECEKLKQQNGMFNIKYYLVLRKRIEVLRLQIESGRTDLRRIEDDLLVINRFWWSVEDCRDHILSLLIYRKNFFLFTHEREKEFEKLEKKKFEDKMNSMNVSWLSERRHVLIDPVEWLALLKEYNQDIKIKLQDISFRYRIAYEQNELRMRRKEMLDEKKIENLQSEVTRITTRIKLQRETYEKVDNVIMDLMGEESSGARKRLVDMEERLGDIEKNIGDLTSEKEDLEREIRKLKSQKNERELEKLEEEIIYRRQENFKRRFLPFFSSEKRREVIRRHFVETIDFLNTQGMSEFGVKLVISILKDHEPETWQQYLLGVVDKFYTPGFYKWGFIHANCQIANVGAHWFSSALVVLTDLAVGKNYEELIAIDCCCPLVVNYHTIFDRVTTFAELIVSSNVNYKYSTANITNQEGFMNCQEFANRMIKALDYTKFFPAVNLYLEELRKELTKVEKQESTNMRFLIVTDAFARVYEKVWKGEGKTANKFIPDKLNRIYFNSHDDVDSFYNACVSIEREHCSMDFKFPGEFQLLKGFDRAFWMKIKKKKMQKSNRNCPFLDIHKHEREEAVKKRFQFENIETCINADDEEEEEEGEDD